jgi:zinc protease
LLPNGLRYLVMSNAHPAGGLSIRLGVQVGSLDETDDERGAAHFVEHLAYDGLDGAAEADLERRFADRGVALGRDRNAETSYRATVYRIDLPATGDGGLDLALRWLRHVTDGARFSEAAVTAERRVILAEREARLEAGDPVREAAARFDFAGLTLPAREPIGTPASLNAMTAAKLTAFYGRWYRPRNAEVTIVGDRPAKALEAQVVAAFSSWADTGPAPARASRGAIDEHRGLDVLTLAAPSQIAQVEVCRVRNAPSLQNDEFAEFQARTRQALWAEILQVRLNRLAEAPSTGIANAQVIAEGPEATSAISACVVAAPTGRDWRPALSIVEAEIGRFAAAGPTDDELEAATKGQRARYRGAVMAAPTRPSELLAAQILETELGGRTTASPREAMRAFDAAVADLTPTDVLAAFRTDWSGAGPLVLVATPTAAQSQAVAAAWAEGAAPREAPAEPPPLAAAWAYEDFGTPGEVVRREAFKSPRFTRLVFANGVILNVMHTDFEKNAALISVILGSGRRQIAPADFFGAEIGAPLFKLQGLGRHDFERISEIFHERTWGVQLGVGADAFDLTGRATARELTPELQLLAAYLSDPGFRDLDAKLKAGIDYFERGYRTKPALLANASLIDEVEPGSPGGLPDPTALGQLTSKTFERILRPALTSSPLEVNIVGDVDVDTAAREVAATFGALPARPQVQADRPDAWFLRFPDKPAPGTLHITHQGPAEKAAVLAVWPLYVARPERRREEYAISLVAAILADQLRHRLRDTQGKTYSPTATSTMPDFGDQGELDASVETAPADADATAEEVRRIAQDLARGEITGPDLEAVRGPRLSRIAQLSETNGFWLDAISTSSRARTSLDDALGMHDLIAAISLAEVKAAAAKWLGPAPYVVIATPAARAAP